MKFFISLLIILSSYSIAHSAENSPWGDATEATGTYKPQKVLYDLTSGNIDTLTGVLDRISYLNKLYNNDPFDTSIVVIVHGKAIPLFAKEKFKHFKDVITRAQNLTFGTNIEYRMCQASAKLHGYEPSDIHGFVKMVLMADAEIVKLQNEEGYAYME